jgi:cell division protein FtsL
MFDFYQRRKFKTVLTSPITRVLLAVLVLLMAYSAYTRYEIAKEMEGRRVDIETDVARLQGHKEGLEKQVRYLSDDRGIEAEMRRQFDVALDNEQVVVIVEPDEAEIKQSTSTYQVSEEPAWYQFWR